MKIYATRKLFLAGILPNPPATQDIGALAERLRALRLAFAAEHLVELVSRSVKEVWNSAQFLDELLRLELERQEERRVAQAIRISHLPSGPTLSNFDFAYSHRYLVIKSKRYRHVSGYATASACCCKVLLELERLIYVLGLAHELLKMASV